jgi:adenine-specific DNA-methyltransferase
MTGESLDILANNLEQLRALFPQVFTEGKLDLEKFKATFTDKIHIAGERYVLNWAGKADAFRALQVPATGTLLPQPEESVNFDEADNIFIEGENLEVLKLLQKAYYNKIKCIIIDPPYNTGSDSFIYPDSFKESRSEYEKRVGDKDEEGQWMKEGLLRKNGKDSGHFHSNWLSMMYPRLFLARNLLTDDGVIFVHIDDNEVHNLRLIMNEVFGEENFVAQIIWQRSKKGDSKQIATIHEYILSYCKNKQTSIEAGIWRQKKEGADEVLAKYDDLKAELNNNHEMIGAEMLKWYKSLKKGDIRLSHKHYRVSDDRGLYFPSDFAGPDDGRKSRPRYDIFHPVTGKPCKKPSTGWRWDEVKTKKALAENPQRIHFGPDESTIPCRKSYLKELSFEPFISVFYRDGRSATLEVEELVGKGVFSFPKNKEVVSDLIKLVTNNDDIVLDFFAGSGTTAHSVIMANNSDGASRKFILAQLPEGIEKDSAAEKSGFKTIAEISRKRIKQVIHGQIAENIKGEKLGFKALKLTDSNFKLWRGKEVNEENLEAQLQLFTHPLADDATPQGVLYELMLKAGIPLTATVLSMQKGGAWFLIAQGELAIALETATPEMIAAILEAKPHRVLMLDECFKNNDQLKTNTVLQMKDAGVEFKTI